jgi:hypothetical protein
MSLLQVLPEYSVNPLWYKKILLQKHLDYRTKMGDGKYRTVSFAKNLVQYSACRTFRRSMLVFSYRTTRTTENGNKWVERQ